MIRFVREAVISLLGWIFIAPIALLTPKRRRSIAVIGRDDGRFLDNAKHFYLQAAQTPQNKTDIVFVSHHADVVAMLENHGFKALHYPSLPAIWFLLRARIAIVDTDDWQGHGWFRYLLSFYTLHARTVQLWHGVAFKRIGRVKWQHLDMGRPRFVRWIRRIVRRAVYSFTRRFPCYDLVISPSVFYRDNVFMPSLYARHHAICGYPRNAFGAIHGGNDAIVQWNAATRLREHIHMLKSKGWRAVLVAPTWRNEGPAPLGLDDATIAWLDTFCHAHRLELFFKFHPYEPGTQNIKGTHLHLWDRFADVYPAMCDFDALVTDFSSIYTDYLLVQRPVVFLAPDLDAYTDDGRGFQFNPHDMMPGPHCQDWQAVGEALLAQWRHDDYADARQHLCLRAFDRLDQTRATERIMAKMRELGWLD